MLVISEFLFIPVYGWIFIARFGVGKRESLFHFQRETKTLHEILPKELDRQAFECMVTDIENTLETFCNFRL